MTPEQIYDFAKYIRNEERRQLVALLKGVKKDYDDDLAHGLDKLIEYFTEGYTT
jgi:hypothetical protein